MSQKLSNKDKKKVQIEVITEVQPVTELALITEIQSQERIVVASIAKRDQILSATCL